jgi:hypothetical protein
MAQKQPDGTELLRLKNSPRRTDLQKANRPVDRLFDLFR